MHNVLVVEDEPGIRNVLRVLLESQGFRVAEAETAERADVEARTHKPDLLLVDLGLPDGDGLDVIRALRAWSPLPVIVLSARTMEAQKVAALDAGADDYVTKPFSAPELLARVRAALRRSASGAEQLATLRLGDTQIDLARRHAQGGAGEIHLTPLEYRVLETLARHAGLVVTQEQLLREAWGPDRTDDSRRLRVCIKGMRQKLEPEPHRPRYLVTEVGLGYRLMATDGDGGVNRSARPGVSTGTAGPGAGSGPADVPPPAGQLPIATSSDRKPP
jgi:two-component system KDP operon response regulator KdpE